MYLELIRRDLQNFNFLIKKIKIFYALRNLDDFDIWQNSSFCRSKEFYSKYINFVIFGLSILY